MYDIVLFIHSVNRWIVLILTFAAVAFALRTAFTGRGGAENEDSALKSALRGLSGIQALIGIALYVWLSPLTRIGWQSPSQIGSNEVVRFWVIIHGPAMLLAVALIHAERGRATPRASLLFLGSALLCLLLAMPWQGLTYGRDLIPSP